MGKSYFDIKKSIRNELKSGNQYNEMIGIENNELYNEINSNSDNSDNDNDNNDDNDDNDNKSEQTRSITDRSESHCISITNSISLSRESTKLLNSQNLQGTPNYDYINSISRLYLLFHNFEDLFPALSPETNSNSSCYKALSILASCPVVSIICSITSLQTPLYLGWDHLTDCIYNWVYIHTPTTLFHEPLPEVVSSVTHASNKIQRDRAVTLKYVLNSLTRKHLDIIKYILNYNNNNNENQNENQSSSNSSQGVRWVILLNYCVSRLIVKSDTELRELISELKDQRIIKTYSDSDGVVFVTLSLTNIEKDSVKEYFQKEKKK